MRTLGFPPYDLFVGEVVQTHGDEDVLTDGRVDFAKVKPMLFDMPSSHYWRLGAPFSKCWDVGRSLKR